MRKISAFYQLCIVATVLALACASGYAMPVSDEFGPNLVTNGGFETGDLSGWTVLAVDGEIFVTSGNSHSGTYSLEEGPEEALGGIPASNYISQNLSTTPGTYYNIHLWFDSSGEFPNELRIDWGGTAVFDQTDIAAVGWEEFSVDPVATSSSTNLELDFLNVPSYDYIDDVSVFQTEAGTAAVPEPMTLSLLGLGLAGLIAKAAKR